MKKKILPVIMIFALITTVFAGCGEESSSPESESGTNSAASSEATSGEETTHSPEGEASASSESKGKIILATTTSTQDSGLLEYILPVFTSETGWDVDTIAVGTGAAIQMGRDGEADVLLVHSRADEDKFVADGCAEKRYDVMYNDYIVVGPKDGEITLTSDVKAAFKSIAEKNLPFVSRGDDSGTHKKELAIWKSVGIDPAEHSVYISAGQGMGATLAMANEMKAYTLSDRATWLTLKSKGDLDIVCEKDANLFNYYGVIPVSSSVSDKINTEGGQAFADWIISPSTQELIGKFGVEEYGQALFTPNAN